MIAAINDHRPPLTRPIEQALRGVPRHWFVPPVGEAFGDDGCGAPIDRDTDPPAWWDAVYAGRPIVAPDGSACPAAGAVADLLELLGPVPGQKVLEVGTGTGWTTALLCRLVGQSGSVTSVEQDAAVAERAAKNLAAAGALPHLVVGDGAAGCPERAPYDRVHVTDAVRAVPYSWVEQARPDAVIVCGFGGEHALRLLVMADGTASGRFSGLTTMTRPQGEPWITLATALLGPGTWRTWGKPGPERLGLTVTPEGQRVWLDHPEQVIA
ncbi:methyltransferase domain-containing protein [Nonomuraea phyllanthi]|uniref:Protein-L-isoaspartate O-methyltransferase n=2 Tax=Nonomuraea phyllanthi TaxID=2219224 RepID=A0A5C4WS85_9ACTN|nr:methyltransferase domain-containing protein [Nonomuraea phyllanthi]QFY14160.1 methyltransferase domain-containing protein [Nonomuraea phyllanthi]